MISVEVRALRRVVANKQGELRADAVERVRHAMRRATKRVERTRRDRWS